MYDPQLDVSTLGITVSHTQRQEATQRGDSGAQGGRIWEYIGHPTRAKEKDSSVFFSPDLPSKAPMKGFKLT